MLTRTLSFINIKRISLLLLFFAFSLRFAYGLYGPQLANEVWSDMKVYVDIGNKISNGVWSKDHFFQSIGYPLIISGIGKFAAPFGLTLSLLQALCSFVSLFCMFHLSLKSLGPRVAFGFLCIGSCHLPWIFFSNFALPETIFTTLLSLCAWLSFRIVQDKKPPLIFLLGWGLFFSIAFWLKGTHAFWGPLFLFSLILKHKRDAFFSVTLISLVVALGLIAHGALTYNKIGKIQLSSSTGGLNFVEGKCPSKINSDSAGYTWQSPLYFQLGQHHAKTWDRPFTDSTYYLKQGLKCIQDNPYVLIQSFESIPYLFFGNTMWPLNGMSQAHMIRLYELFFAIFVIAGFSIYLMTHLRSEKNRSEFIIWVVPVFSLFMTVYIFKSEIRYRIPFDLWFIPLSVKGWFTLFQFEKPR